MEAESPLLHFGRDPRKAVQLTRNTGDLPEESADGKFLYYKKDDLYPNQCSVWRMPTGGGRETRILESTDCLSPFAIGQQGIYFLTPFRLYDLSTGKTHTILTGIGPAFGPGLFAVSPDGRTISIYGGGPGRRGSDACRELPLAPPPRGRLMFLAKGRKGDGATTRGRPTTEGLPHRRGPGSFRRPSCSKSGREWTGFEWGFLQCRPPGSARGHLQIGGRMRR
jgi:hypothetical protein